LKIKKRVSILFHQDERLAGTVHCNANWKQVSIKAKRKCEDEMLSQILWAEQFISDPVVLLLSRG